MATSPWSLIFDDGARPKAGTGTPSGHGSALKIARWWHCQQHTSSDRTPLARMLPKVITSIW
jgi:hypothetical protein